MSNEIQKANKNKPFESLLGSVSEEKFFKPNCKICSSGDRDEIEKHFEENGSNIKNTLRYIKEKGFLFTRFGVTDTSLSYDAAYRHFTRHYNKRKLNEAVIDYLEGSTQYVLDQVRRKQALEDRRAILNKNMIEISTMSEDSSLDQRLKSADGVNKIMAQLRSVEEQIDELDKKFEPINILMDILVDSVHKHIEKYKDTINEEFKTILLEIIQDVQLRAEAIKGESEKGD